MTWALGATVRRAIPFLVLLFSMTYFSTAQRRPLEPPPLFEFRPLDSVTEEYRSEVLALGELIEAADAPALREPYKVLVSTLNQPRLAASISEIIDGVVEMKTDPAREVRPGLLEEIHVLALTLRRRITHTSPPDFYLRDGNYPIELEVDRERRVYLLKWREWAGRQEEYSGDYIVWEVPFVPRMDITVAATCEKDAGGGFRYGYLVSNGPSSEATVGLLTVEAVGLTPERARLFDKGLNLFPLEGRKQRLFLWTPSLGKAQYVLLLSDSTIPGGMIVRAGPGEALDFPPVRAAPWENLPGIVGGWADAGDYHSRLDPHAVPENAFRDIFKTAVTVTTEYGTTSVPRAEYHGKTVGPVPLPPAGTTRGRFLETIRGYLKEAREWGWYPDGPTADALEEALAALASTPDRTGDFAARLNRLLDEVEEAYREERILHETWALLRFNLLHLRELPP